MDYDWDEAKRRVNREKHGLDFVDVVRFDWGNAVIRIDHRRDYGEVRLNAVGVLDGQRVSITFTMRGRTRRIISLRRDGKG